MYLALDESLVSIGADFSVLKLQLNLLNAAIALFVRNVSSLEEKVFQLVGELICWNTVLRRIFVKLMHRNLPYVD